jgi:CDP-glycerol glycerophosphotransferase
MKKRRILFYAFSGKEYSCSPKYIAERIESRYPGQYEIIWAVNNPEKFHFLEEKGWKVIKYKSLMHVYYSVTSKIIITNTGPFKAVANRNGQELINTWHGGGAYKKIGMDNPYKDKYEILYNKNMGQAGVTLFISSSKRFTKYEIRGAFGYSGVVLECGLPRNDLFFDKNLKEKIQSKVREELHINVNQKIVLYAPTWRNYSMESFEKLDVDGLVKTLNNQTGLDWVFVYRGHNLSNSMAVDSSSNVINATDYKDMQELLVAADILISDYSSCIWDYSLMLKPGYLYTPDLEKYDSKFAFYTPIEAWGYPVVRTNEELVAHIKQGNEVDYKRRLEENHLYFQNAETGSATDTVVDYIVKVIQGD